MFTSITRLKLDRPEVLMLGLDHPAEANCTDTTIPRDLICTRRDGERRTEPSSDVRDSSSRSLV